MTSSSGRRMTMSSEGKPFRLFTCKRAYSESGGLIVVTARDADEAFRTFEEWDFANGMELRSGIDHRTGKVCVKYNHYPQERWYAIEGITTDATEPRVLAENGMTL